MTNQTLHDHWTVSAVTEEGVPAGIAGRRFAAAVPGCVHTDLLRHGAIEDPYVERNEIDAQWIGLTDWSYQSTFTADAALFDRDRIELVCDGLDTIATVSLNGRTLGHAANMHHPHRFDVKAALKRGENKLIILFKSPVKHVREMAEKIGSLPWLNTPEPFAFIRKFACGFGWDWGPTLATVGIWRPIRLEAWDTARITAVRPLIAFAKSDGAQVRVLVDIERAETSPDHPLALRIELVTPSGEHETQFVPVPAGQSTIETLLDIENPDLWWPITFGDQPLYGIHVDLATGRESDAIDTWSGRIGLREVELDTSHDDFGRRFVIKINGREIFCKGFNWIPDDCFLDRACTPGRYRRRIEQAIGANANMLRVWGGGLYETNDFYDICDELGVLVWQDCLFACAGYPEEEPYPALVEQELRHNIARLSRHPSLVLWNGCNENLWGFYQWKEFKPLHSHARTWGAGYYLDLIPRILNELDRSRPYWPASPFSHEWAEVKIGETMKADTPIGVWNVEKRAFDGPPPERQNGLTGRTGLHPNDEHAGNKHVWEAWFGEEYRAYRRFKPRFCSEFGFQAPAAYATTLRALGEHQMSGQSPNYAHHQRSPSGDRNNQRHLDTFFDSPDPAGQFDDWHFLLQLNQARALQLGVEYFRSIAPICMGALYWQLNDCWPVTSWSAIDGDGHFKPLYFATRRFFAPSLYTIQPETADYKSGDPLWLCALNDSDESRLDRVRITRRAFDGRILARQDADVPWSPRAVSKMAIDRDLFTPDDASREFITVDAATPTQWYFDVDKNLRYPEADLDAALDRVPGGYRLTLNARTFIRDLAIFIDRLDPDGTISDQLITLLPGQSVTLDIATKRELTRTQLLSPPVMQSANRFGRKE